MVNGLIEISSRFAKKDMPNNFYMDDKNCFLAVVVLYTNPCSFTVLGYSDIQIYR